MSEKEIFQFSLARSDIDCFVRPRNIINYTFNSLLRDQEDIWNEVYDRYENITFNSLLRDQKRRKKLWEDFIEALSILSCEISFSYT